MSVVDKAAKYFEDGNTCSQSVFTTFAPELNLSKELALKIACPFGGGIAKTASICGAVSGAIMVIGLKHGRVDAADSISREKCDAIVLELMEEFEQKFNSILCYELLGFDKDDQQGLVKAKETGLTKTICPNFVKYAVKVLEEIL